MIPTGVPSRDPAAGSGSAFHENFFRLGPVTASSRSLTEQAMGCTICFPDGFRLPLLLDFR